MTATMTTTHSVVQDPVEAQSPRIEDVQSDLRTVAALVSDMDPRGAGWSLVGPMLSETAAQARRAIGLDVPSGVVQELSPIVRQRELAVVARRLLRRDVAIVDAGAALGVRELRTRISMALT